MQNQRDKLPVSELVMLITFAKPKRSPPICFDTTVEPISPCAGEK